MSNFQADRSGQWAREIGAEVFNDHVQSLSSYLLQSEYPSELTEVKEPREFS